MLIVKISKPSSARRWLDHLGKEIDALVFSKDYHSKYIPGFGYYPLESFGSLYRNIDNFRESPLQSRTDWEIRIPGIYSPADGGPGILNLLFWLESINGDGFLLGCDAALYDDGNLIYIGVVESIVYNGETTTLRISDWLGNPKGSQSDYPIVIGAAGKWPVKITSDKNRIEIKISSTPLEFPPDFYIKTESGFVKVDLRVDPSHGMLTISYIEQNMKAVLTVVSEQKNVSLADDIGYDDFALLKATNASGVLASNVLRPSESKDTPDYYLLGDSENSEVIEVWSNRYWIDEKKGLCFPVGRPEISKRHSHTRDAPIRSMKEIDILLNVRLFSYLESITFNHGTIPNNSTFGLLAAYSAPYQIGNPSQLVLNSRAGAGPFDSCPILVGKLLEFTVNLSSFGLDDVDGNLRVNPKKSFLHVVIKKIKGSGSTHGVCRFSGSNEAHFLDLKSDLNINRISVNELLKNMRQVKFEITNISSTVEIQVVLVRLECEVDGFPLGGNKLYAGGHSSIHSSGATVRPAIRALLRHVLIKSDLPSGEDNGLIYGLVTNGEAFNLRDKLRTLAAESATFVSMDARSKKIIVKDISLLEDPLVIVHIPLDAFVLNGNIYAFKMESPDRSDLLSSLTIRWGKDIGTGKYRNVLSVSYGGISREGEDPYTSEGRIPEERWAIVYSNMLRNIGIGTHKSIDSEW